MKKFEEFITEGIVSKRSPNMNRVKSLIEEAEKRSIFLEELKRKVKVN